MKITVEHPPIPRVIERIGNMENYQLIRGRFTFIKHGRDITIRQNALSPVDTGKLSASNVYSIDSVVNGIELTLRNDTPYGKFQEFGTGMSGAAATPPYMPPGTSWNYGAAWKGHKPQSFFFPPILMERDKILESFKKDMWEVSQIVTDIKS